MSCSWSVYCLDCRNEGGATVERDMPVIRTLIRHRQAIAGIAALCHEPYPTDVVLGFDCGVNGVGRIDVSWFVEHHTHRLAPYNEYGQFADMTCARCKEAKDVRPLNLGQLSAKGLYCFECEPIIIADIKAAMANYPYLPELAL